MTYKVRLMSVAAVAYTSLTAVWAGEREEVERLAPKYKAAIEYRLWDDTRVDLLSKRYAIEVDWAEKWAEAIGQSLYYATLTDRRPAIILLVTSADDRRFVYRCQTVCAKAGIRLFVERAAFPRKRRKSGQP